MFVVMLVIDGFVLLGLFGVLVIEMKLVLFWISRL